MLLNNGKSNIDQFMGHFDRLNPNYQDAVMNAAGVLSEQQKYVEAEEFYKRALTLEPRNGDAYNNYAVFLGNMGEYERCVSVTVQILFEHIGKDTFRRVHVLSYSIAGMQYIRRSERPLQKDTINKKQTTNK